MRVEVEVGPEYDAVLREAVLAELKAMGGIQFFVNAFDLDYQSNHFLVHWRHVTMTSDLYMGLRLIGPPAVVHEVARRAQAIRVQKGPRLDDVDYAQLFTFYAGRPRHESLPHDLWADKRKGVNAAALARYMAAWPNGLHQWRQFLDLQAVRTEAPQVAHLAIQSADDFHAMKADSGAIKGT